MVGLWNTSIIAAETRDNANKEINVCRIYQRLFHELNAAKLIIQNDALQLT
jgi:hypothetical protein